jgi:hypothetical protein
MDRESVARREVDRADNSVAVDTGRKSALACLVLGRLKSGMDCIAAY